MKANRQLLYESDESLIYVEDKTPQGKQVLKVLRSNAPDMDQLLHFNNEYEYTKDLQIEGVRKAISQEKNGLQHALVLEYIEGVTLEAAFLHQRRSVEEILEAFIKISDTLGHLHERGIIHKDINTKNILWIEQEKKPVIIDFGISNRIDLSSNHLGNPDNIKGTLTHMSPEQTGRVNRKVDNRSDLYSLGITMFQLFTGKLPYESGDSLELVHFHIARSIPLIHRENPDIPEVISRIVAKLMEKNAEDRYRTAFGLKYDLEKCLAQWQKWQKIHDFALGEKDYSGKFRIPQKLYGRYEEVKTLLKAFHRVRNGSTELFLVAGYSGVGKSALISELYKPITERRGYLVGGKFDQYQRDIPYFAIIQAFTQFCNYLLTEKKETLERWKNALLNSVGENGQVLIDMIPALQQIIGQQPEVAQLEAQEALNRFNLVFQNFIRTISQPEHPLVLFVDDLQWADVASLNLIKLLITDLRNPYFLVIGAYRDNEVGAGHPLLHMINEATQEQAVATSILLNPLQEEHLFQIIQETLQIDDSSAQDLSELVFSKTIGNAFFTIEFLKSLNQQGLVRYNFNQHIWNVQLEAIRKRSITDNVVDLMVSKIEKMPPATQEALKVASCIGGLFDLQLFSVLYGKDIRKSLEDLWVAIAEGLLLPVGDQYQYIDAIRDYDQLKVDIEFAHDRVQQAAYSLMIKEDCQRRHLQIGRLLVNGRHKSSIKLFDIVNHFNKGSNLIDQEVEQYQLSSLNLKAAIQARNSSAFQSALTYVNMAKSLAGNAVWEKDCPFALKLYKTSADIEYLNGNFDTSEALIHLCLAKAQSPAEKAEIYFMLMQNQSNSTQYFEAIDSARQGLKLLDFEFPDKEYETLIPTELGKILHYFKQHGVASVFHKPNMQDQRMLAIMNILDNLSPPTYVTGQTYAWILHVLYKINLTIAHGLTPQGGYAFSELGLIFFIQNNYEYAYPAALLSKRMVEKFHKQSPRHLSRAGHLFTNYNTPWVKHISETFKLNPEYYQISLDSGELIYAGYTSFYPFYNAYYLGSEPLDALLNRIPDALEFTKNIRHDLAHDSLRALQMVMTHLAGKTSSSDSFDLPEMTEAAFLIHCHEVKDGYGSTMLHLFKAQAYHLQGDMKAALVCLQTTHEMVGVIAGNATQDTTFRMYYALTLLALLDHTEENIKTYWQQIEEHRQQFKIWSDNNTPNFEHKYLLIEAEIERVKGNVLQALEHYRRAILSAEQFGFERETALIHQKAAACWLSLDNNLYAKSHLERARYIFEKLGYQRLVDQIDGSYKQLLSPAPRTTSTITHHFTSRTLKSATTNFGELDIISIMKSANALSEEIVLDKLLGKMLLLSIENAGGQRAVLLLQNFAKWMIVADLNIEKTYPPVNGSRDLEEAKDIPVTVINYVIRTRSEVVSHLNSSQNIFERDKYLKTEQPASYLCMPLTYKGEISGILYLEHKTLVHAFTAERLDVLRMLTSQMAVSLENASLYNQQLELNKAYQRFVPLDFIQALAHQSILQVKLGDHIQQEMTVLFCDIRSYSAMAEGMTSEENFNFLNEYLKLIGPIIRKHQGFINHYVGDGFIALFKDNPENALLAAIQTIEEIGKHNQKHENKGRKPIILGFGIHTGEVMMGIIGDADRHDANVISDAVNTASRLEGLTKIFGANIILSDKTLKRLTHTDRFQFRYLGRIKVKGKEDVLEVYEMFSADEPGMKENKLQTLDNFNKGIIDYFNKRFAEAALSLRKVLDENPLDKTALRYLQNAAHLMVEGTPQNWDGVEMMTEK